MHNTNFPHMHNTIPSTPLHYTPSVVYYGLEISKKMVVNFDSSTNFLKIYNQALTTGCKIEFPNQIFFNQTKTG